LLVQATFLQVRARQFPQLTVPPQPSGWMPQSTPNWQVVFVGVQQTGVAPLVLQTCPAGQQLPLQHRVSQLFPGWPFGWFW
jgi:hypothetical protein